MTNIFLNTFRKENFNSPSPPPQLQKRIWGLGGITLTLRRSINLKSWGVFPAPDKKVKSYETSDQVSVLVPVTLKDHIPHDKKKIFFPLS